MRRRPTRVLASLALPVSLLALLAPPAMSQQQPEPDAAPEADASDADRPRARDVGVEIGVLPTGLWNAITDVRGVRVGHVSVVEGDSVRTGVTAVHAHGGNAFRERVPAAIHVGNGFGKLVGVTQVRELGELETPVLLTCTLCVWRAADAVVGWMLEQEGMEGVRSINPVVGETNDGFLNDIRARPIRPGHVRQALDDARSGEVAEGSVGAGVGTRAFGWKGGIGTASRVVPDEAGGYTVGVLVQTNFGGALTIDGAPVGRELAGRRTAVRDADPTTDAGSIMIVVATDAPLLSRNLERLASRALLGLGRTGSWAGNGSGDYVIAFSTAEEVRRGPGREALDLVELPNDRTSPLFRAVVEATEEAIVNSLFRATTVRGHRGAAEALPLEPTLEILRTYGVIDGGG